MIEPRTRRERMLLRACTLLAEKGKLPITAVTVAIAQADEEEPASPPKPAIAWCGPLSAVVNGRKVEIDKFPAK